MERDYNKEIIDNGQNKYAYAFDSVVMYPFMMKGFDAFWRQGNLLELGSFKGNFTKLLLEKFDDVTCVEASADAIAQVPVSIKEKVSIINSTFEQVRLPRKYDNIVMTHVLEHLDDPVSVLVRIKNEWLSDKGHLFVACPNANAPSRQIAVKMGLISHNAAVTAGELAHGHRITYSLDTLSRDLKASGLTIVHSSGIFFKALANFQWDKLINTDIITKEYLDGCYELGLQYPDLCSSIFFVCKK